MRSPTNVTKGYRPEELLAVLTRLFVFQPDVVLKPDHFCLLGITRDGEQVGYIDLSQPRASVLPELKQMPATGV